MTNYFDKKILGQTVVFLSTKITSLNRPPYPKQLLLVIINATHKYVYSLCNQKCSITFM